jgi:hypothetical protein
MATLQDNDGQLIIGGVDVSGDATSCEIEQKVGIEDTTKGFGTDHEGNGAKLIATTITGKIMYDTTNYSTNIAVLTPGDTQTIIWRPEGNTGGKPEHEQSFVIETVKQTAVTVDKASVMLEFTGRSTGAPTTDMFNGGTV